MHGALSLLVDLKNVEDALTEIVPNLLQYQWFLRAEVVEVDMRMAASQAMQGIDYQIIHCNTRGVQL